MRWQLTLCSGSDVLNARVIEVEDDGALAQGIALSHCHRAPRAALPSQRDVQPKQPPCKSYGTSVTSSAS